MIKPKFSHWSLVGTFTEIDLKPNISSTASDGIFLNILLSGPRIVPVLVELQEEPVGSQIWEVKEFLITKQEGNRSVQGHIDFLCFRESSPDMINARVTRCSFPYFKGHLHMTLVRTSTSITYPSWYNIICSPHEREQEIQKGFWEIASWRSWWLQITGPATSLALL